MSDPLDALMGDEPERLRVLELFAGLGGGSSAFRDSGHHVVTTDLDPRFDCTVTGDILSQNVVDELVRRGPYDFVWASPPCEGFSVMNIGKNWTKDHEPKTDTARLGLAILERTIELLHGAFSGASWVIENPRGKMRRMPQMESFDRATVWYCRYGLTIAKPTDIWTSPGMREFWTPRPECNNGNPDHQSAPRGSKSGIQGIMSSAERALVPFQLSDEIRLAVEGKVFG